MTDTQATDDTEATEVSEDTEEPAAEEAPARREFTFSWPVLAGAAALLVVLLAATVVFGWMLLAKSGEESARESALATATSYAVTVTSYDYQDIDTNVADVLDGATGDFRDQYAGASEQLQKLITKAKATATGEVVHAGVKSASDDRAEVLLFVDQTVTNAGAKKPQVDRSRMLLRMEKHDDRWLVSKLQML